MTEENKAADAGEQATATLLSKKGSKKKAAAAADRITAMAQTIENLTEAQAHVMVKELNTTEGDTDYALGGVLAKIRENSWHPGYSTFKDYVEQTTGWAMAKAHYVMGIYTTLTSAGLNAEYVDAFSWSKLREITSGKAPLLNAENAQMWLEKAQTMNYLEFYAYVRSLKKGTSSADGSAAVTDEITKKTFNLHKDQAEIVTAALDRAKGELNTEYDTVALEGICLGYMGKTVAIQTQAKDIDIVDMLKTYPGGIEAILTALSLAYPDATINAEI